MTAKFRSISVSTEAYDALYKLRAWLLAEGTARLPRGLTPPTTITLSSIILLGVEAIEGPKRPKKPEKR